MLQTELQADVDLINKVASRVKQNFDGNLDQSKLDKQLQIMKLWVANYRRGTLEAVTGFGKTLVAIMGLLYLQEDLKQQGQPISDIPEDYLAVVVVPTDPLRSSWRNLVASFGLSDYVYVDTIHMIAKKQVSAKLLILDEIHRYVGETAEVFPRVFTNVDNDYCFGLTATLGFKGIMREMVDANCPVLETVTTEEAVNNGWVASHVTYNLGIPFPNSERAAYNKLNDKFYKYFSTFDYDFDVMRKCTSDPDFNKRFARRRNWDPEWTVVHAVQGMRAMRERKEFLYNHPLKLEAAAEIAKRFSDRKILTFSQSTDFADKLAEEVGPQALAYHSSLATKIYLKEDIDEDTSPLDLEPIAVSEMVDVDGNERKRYRLTSDGQLYTWSGLKKAVGKKLKRYGKKTLKKETLDIFSADNSPIRVLCAARALDVGYDEEDITMGIVASGWSSVRQNIQRSGRIIRYLPGKRAIIVNLYLIDSQDEKWLRDRQKESSNIQWIYAIEDIV